MIYPHVPYNREETDVLFTLLAERYEMRSVLITSNLVFAKAKFRKMSIDQKHEEATITTNANNGINPLVNLLMLKALHDGICQEVLKTYVEYCLAEIQISKNQKILENFRYEDSLARLQLYGNYNDAPRSRATRYLSKKL